MAGEYTDLKGTSNATLQIEKSGVKLKNSSGNLLVRNAADGADANLTAALVNISGNSLVLNSDGAGSASDWSWTLSRPSSGMTANVALSLPPNLGTNGQVLQTLGDGTTQWATAATTADKITSDVQVVAFNSSSTVTFFTLPANAVYHRSEVIIDTVFNGSPSLTIGPSGTPAKYMGSNQNDLTSGAGDRWTSNPNNTASGSSEAVIITYSAGSASQGSARVIAYYSIPN